MCYMVTVSYSDKYAAQLALRSNPGYHETFIDPCIQVDMELDLWMTARFYCCAVCRTKTEFRDLSSGHSVAVCSEVCRLQSKEWQKESEEVNGESNPEGLRTVEAGLQEVGDLALLQLL